MAERWREFEVLIAQVESVLAPVGAVVKSPDQIPDLVTGQLREVDASIRHHLGSASILITIECRHRSRPADVTWIEQLATKKTNIGASKTLAISEQGFSQEAVDLARRSGIEVRKLSELSAESVLKLMQLDAVTHIRPQIVIDAMHYAYFERPSPPFFDLAPEVVAQLQATEGGGCSARVFQHEQSQTLVSASDIWENAELSGFDVTKFIPTDGKQHRHWQQ